MLEPPQAGRGGVVPDWGHDEQRGDHPDTLAPELTAGQEARALLVERLEHVGGKVDHGGLLCHRQAVSGIVVRVCHVASRTVCWVGMPARVNIYVEEACAVVNTGGGVRRPLTTLGSGYRHQCRMACYSPHSERPVREVAWTMHKDRRR